TVVDATVGNGHDTLFLASLVGPEGKVIGFDIQQEAITQTAERTAANGQVTLHRAGHERMAEFLSGSIQAAMFNLGYLPGGDKAVTTHSATTLAALSAATEFLSEGGIITVALYTGHPGGSNEAGSVIQWARELPQDQYSVSKYEFINQRNSPPALLAIQKRS
ncbi:MAG: class I SAM-dependent methyltransferase, partial [Verrucomicrobiales bacterium]|nr:class I SAM-dependent methyltransferase [Verrucomicrobiales bacterium]